MMDRLLDCLMRFQQQVGHCAPDEQECPMGDEGGVVCAFLSALGGLFMTPRLLVVWHGAGGLLGAALAEPGAAAERLGPEEARAAVQRIDGLPRDEATVAPLVLSWIGPPEALHAVHVRLAAEAHAPQAGRIGAVEQLWIIRQDGGRADNDWRNVVVLKSLYLTLLAILHARAGAIGDRRASEVKRLVQGAGPDFPAHLREAGDLLDRLTRESVPRLDLVRDVAVYVLQALCSTGWTVGRPEDQVPPLRRLLPILQGAALGALQAGQSPAGPEYEQIVCVIRCLHAFLCPDQPLAEAWELGAGVDPLLGLLPVWLRVHELWRPLTQVPGDTAEQAAADQAWAQAAGRTGEQLAIHLSRVQTWRDPAGAPVAPGEAPDGARPHLPLRDLLTLWFCLQILGHERQHPLADDLNRSVLRAELAYVLREALRFVCLGALPDYLINTATYAAAMRTLLGYHAHRIVGLPAGYDVRRMLSLIGKEEGLGLYVAAEHLQHVTEVYLFGQFLLSLRLSCRQPPSGPPAPASAVDGMTVAAALGEGAGLRGPAGAETLRRAFGLAALTHDVGHLLQFRIALQRESQEDPVLGTPLRALLTELHRTILQRGQARVEELRLAGHLGPAGAEGRDWLGTLEDSPEHGMLGAWYLHRLALSLREPDTEMGRAALRGVLLHAAPVDIDAAQEPVAALLVLCNEVFGWDPLRRPGTQSSPLSRSLHVMAADMPARGLRDRGARIAGLRLDWLVQPGAEFGGRLEATLEITDPAGRWPEVHLALHVERTLCEPTFIPVLRRWLEQACSLGRIAGSPQGFSPAVVARVAIDPALRARRLTNRRLLQQILNEAPALPNAWMLREWLTASWLGEGGDGPGEAARLGFEAARLGWHPFRPPALDDCLRDIERGAKEILQRSPRIRPPTPAAGVPTPPAPPPRGVRLCYLHSQRDEGLRAELEKHIQTLVYRGVLDPAGSRPAVETLREGAEEAAQKIVHTGGIVLIMLSADLLANPVGYNLIRRTIELAQGRSIRVLPLRLRPVRLDASLLGGLQALPRNGGSVTELLDRDSIWTEVVLEIEQVARDLRPTEV